MVLVGGCVPQAPVDPPTLAPTTRPPAKPAPELRSGRFVDPLDIATLSARYSPGSTGDPDPAPLAFRIAQGVPVAVPSCELLGQNPTARFHRVPDRLSPEEALARGPVGGRTRHVLAPTVAPEADVLQVRRIEWPLQGLVLRRGSCEGVSHASSAIELGMRMDAAAGDECGDLEDLQHPADVLETNCPMDVVAFELQAIDLAPMGSEAERIVEPMLQIRGGQFDGIAIESFWIDRDEVGHEAFARCVRAGACGDGTEPRRVSPFADGPATMTIEDAPRYCAWVGKRLPTLREWQWAARGRDEGRPHPWGDAPPDFDRVCAVDARHERGVQRADLDVGDPRFRAIRSEGAWFGLWKRVADARGIRPQGESRDGVRDMIGNMREVVLSNAEPGAALITVGGSFRNYLPDHSEITLVELAENPDDDDEADAGLRAFHNRAMAALTVEGATLEGFEMRGDYGRLGVRCAADTPPEGATLEPDIRAFDRSQALFARGLRRLSESTAVCVDRRLATQAELESFASQSMLLKAPYWTAGGLLRQPDGTTRKPASGRATAHMVCVSAEVAPE